jgi:hypothetical protein
MAVTNTLAYYDTATITAKKYNSAGPRAYFINFFLDLFKNKLERPYQKARSRLEFSLVWQGALI